MSPTATVLLGALNACLCLAIGWVCLCRISVMRGSTRLLARAAYVMVMGAAFLGAVQIATPPAYSWPSLAQVVGNVALLMLLIAGRGAWADGPPAHTLRRDYLDTDQQPWVVGGKQ